MIFSLIFSPFTILGVLIVYKVVTPKRAPMDDSNVFNHLTLLWLVITKPHLFVGKHPFFSMDEQDKIEHIDRNT